MLFCFLFLNHLHLGVVPFFQFWIRTSVSWRVMCEEVGRNELEHLRSFNSCLSHIILSLNYYIFCLRPFLSIYVVLSLLALGWTVVQRDSVKCLELEVFCVDVVVNFCSADCPASVVTCCLSFLNWSNRQKIKMMRWYTFLLYFSSLLFWVMELFQKGSIFAVLLSATGLNSGLN